MNNEKRLLLDIDNKKQVINIEYGYEITIEEFQLFFNQALKYNSYAKDYKLNFKKIN
jgi:hypothetical protein